MKIDKMIKLLQSKGYERLRQKGSHIIMRKPGVIKPIILVRHNQSSTISPRLLKRFLEILHNEDKTT